MRKQKYGGNEVLMRFMVLIGCACGFMVSAAWAQSPSSSALQLVGKGVQIYACAASDSGYAWKLSGPEASLSDKSGKVIGKHFAGPTWQAADGSTVVGELLVSSPAPQAGSVPWLVLRAKAHNGHGLFESVSFITRTETEGGVAPASGCDASHSAAQVRVPYTAIYTLFRN
jgi:Protein of unknown function (DUF3455)